MTEERMTEERMTEERMTEERMTEERLPLAELLAKAGDGDLLCSAAGAVLLPLMEVDVEGLIGGGCTARSYSKHVAWSAGSSAPCSARRATRGSSP